MKFRKKPVIIEAVIWTGFNLEEVYEFMHPEEDPLQEQFKDPEYIGFFANYEENVKTNGLEIKTLEGTMKANVGDYIIKGVNGEYYPCKPDIFVKSYEEVIE